MRRFGGFIRSRPPRDRRATGEMNKTEAAYQLWLESEVQRGELLDVLPFESMTFKLAADMRYTPDFPVVLVDGTLELRDTKGSKRKKRDGVVIGTEAYIEEDAKLKIKIAAERFPQFRWALIWLDPSGWMRKEISS